MLHYNLAIGATALLFSMVSVNGYCSEHSDDMEAVPMALLGNKLVSLPGREPDMPKKSGNRTKKTYPQRSSRWDKDFKPEQVEQEKTITLKSDADFLNLKNIDLDVGFSLEGDMTQKKFDKLIRKRRRQEKWKNFINRLKSIPNEEYVQAYSVEKYQSNPLNSAW